MFDLDTWIFAENRSDRQKEVEAIFLPYKCGKIEAELIAIRFNAHVVADTYYIIQPKFTGLLE